MTPEQIKTALVKKAESDCQKHYGVSVNQDGPYKGCYSAKDVNSLERFRNGQHHFSAGHQSTHDLIIGLVTALEFAGGEIHSEFCGKEHHEYCDNVTKALSNFYKQIGC